MKRNCHECLCCKYVQNEETTLPTTIVLWGLLTCIYSIWLFTSLVNIGYIPKNYPLRQLRWNEEPTRILLDLKPWSLRGTQAPHPSLGTAGVRWATWSRSCDSCCSSSPLAPSIGDGICTRQCWSWSIAGGQINHGNKCNNSHSITNPNHHQQ